MADGVPTPTITWKKPDGTEVRKVTATENIADIEMKTDEDFGQYTCEAKNDAGPVDTRTVQVQQISKDNNETFYYAMKISTGSALFVGSFSHSCDQFKNVFLLLCPRITDDCTMTAALDVAQCDLFWKVTLLLFGKVPKVHFDVHLTCSDVVCVAFTLC